MGFSDSLRRFDVYSTNKTHDDLKVRTLTGAMISVCFGVLAVCLFTSEFRQWRALETVDRLDVDTSARPDSKLPVNVDIYLPSLPCGEFVTEVTDESGSQELRVTDTLQKLRISRDGVPIDLPERVDWDHQIAPAFQQRKVVSLMEEAQQHLAETMSHLEHEATEHPELDPNEHEMYRAQLAQQAAQLHGRLSQLTDVAAAGDESEASSSPETHLEMSAQELQNMHVEVENSRLFSDEQREKVLANLHAMAKSVARLRNGTSDATALNLREALRIRLSILSDNVHGFVSAADIDRRDRYGSVQELLNDVSAQADLLPAITKKHVNDTLTQLSGLLQTLNTGLSGARRSEIEGTFDRKLREVQAELRGEDDLPTGYCGSCYGAGATDGQCCNTCAELKEAYASKRWGFPDPQNFEQCRRESRSRMTKLQEGEGCNIYGTMEVARVTGTFSIAPLAKLSSAKLQRLQGPSLLPTISAFNVTHQIKRLSFGTDFPGQHNPLDGVWTHSPAGAAVSKYFLKVVPTTYEFVGGKSVHTNQFSVTHYFKALTAESAQAMVPQIAFTFELTPIKVRKTEERGGTFIGFLTRCAALIGGLFTVAGILDGTIYQSTRHLEKMQLNKQG